jgi:hypothetical protein
MLYAMIPPLLSIEVLEELVGVVGALAVPLLGRLFGLQPFFDAILSLMKRKAPPSPAADLLVRLKSASSEMDSVIGELQAAANEKLTTVTTLESSINELIEKEKKLRETIEGTEGLSKATVEAFAKIVGEKLEKVERPKKRRDYVLFAAGVLVSAAVGIGIEATKPIWVKALHLPPEATTTVSGNRGKAAPPPQADTLRSFGDRYLNPHLKCSSNPKLTMNVQILIPNRHALLSIMLYMA